MSQDSDAGTGPFPGAGDVNVAPGGSARFPEQAILESFDFGYNPKLPAAQIRDLARLEFIAAGEGIIAHGPLGVGKSVSPRRWATMPDKAIARPEVR